MKKEEIKRGHNPYFKTHKYSETKKNGLIYFNKLFFIIKFVKDIIFVSYEGQSL